MPKMPIGEVRVAELHLPRINRGDISDVVSKLEWPEGVPSPGDVGQAIAAAAAGTHIGRRTRRPRWPWAAGALIVAGLAGWAIQRNAALRTRLASATAALGERISDIRARRSGGIGIEADDPIAFPAAKTMPIEDSPFTDDLPTTDEGDYPAGLGSNNGDGIPALEQTGSRA